MRKDSRYAMAKYEMSAKCLNLQFVVFWNCTTENIFVIDNPSTVSKCQFLTLTYLTGKNFLIFCNFFIYYT